MYKNLWVIGCILGASSLSCSQLINNSASTTVKIIAFNDFHGHLQSPGNFGVQKSGSGADISEKPAGGIDMLAAYVNDLKEKNPQHVVVSAGDLIGASPLISGLFHDEATIETMNRLGLEFNAVGNHEFDEGLTELIRMQNGGCHPTDSNSCKGKEVGTPYPFEGAKFKFLAANVVNKATNTTVFPAYGIKLFRSVAGRDLKVAFIGMTLTDTQTKVMPGDARGLSFKDEADTVNALLPKLQAQGVEAIVVLIHQGGKQALTAPNFINDCAGSLQDAKKSPVVSIVNRLDDAVDLVISGHTHTGFNCRLPNRQGRLIPVTQAVSYGRVLTDIDLTIANSSGDVQAVKANNITVERDTDTYTVDEHIQHIVEAYAQLVAPLTAKPVGSISAEIKASADVNGENPAGELIADAQLQATQAVDSGGAQMAMINAGGIRGKGFAGSTYPYDVTYGEAFNLQPFANHLVTMTLTAKQIKDVLEQQFVGGGCVLADGVSTNHQAADSLMQYSHGFHVEWRSDAPACHKIINVRLTSYDAAGKVKQVDQIVNGGKVTHPAKTYRLTVNNFLASGGDNFSVFTQGQQLQTGVEDIDALAAYLSKFLSKSGYAAYDPGDKKWHKPRVIRLQGE